MLDYVQSCFVNNISERRHWNSSGDATREIGRGGTLSTDSVTRFIVNIEQSISQVLFSAQAK